MTNLLSCRPPLSPPPPASAHRAGSAIRAKGPSSSPTTRARGGRHERRSTARVLGLGLAIGLAIGAVLAGILVTVPAGVLAARQCAADVEACIVESDE